MTREAGQPGDHELSPVRDVRGRGSLLVDKPRPQRNDASANSRFLFACYLPTMPTHNPSVHESPG